MKYDCKKDQIDLLFDVFDKSYRSSGNIRGYAAELRTFLELVHLSVADVLEIRIKTVHSVKGDGGREFQITQWRDELLQRCGSARPDLKESVKKEIRPEYFQILNQAYGFTSGLVHPSGADVPFDYLNFAQSQAMRFLPTYFRQCDRIGIDLAANVILRDGYDKPLYFGQLLFDAMARAEALGELQWEGDVLHTAKAMAHNHQVDLSSLLLFGEPREQARRLLTASLTPLIAWGESCPLFQVARALALKTNLSEWFKTYSTEGAKQPRRRGLPTLRLVLSPPPELSPFQVCPSGHRLRPLGDLLQSGDWEIRGPLDFWDEDGKHRELLSSISAQPSSERELAAAIYECVTGALRELPFVDGRARRPADLVLWLSLPLQFVFYDWEGLKLKRGPFPPEGTALAQDFLTIVIDVSDPKEYQANHLPDPLRRDDVVVYQMCNRDDWYSDHRPTVAVALRDAWTAAPMEIPAVQNGFSGRAVVVQIAEGEAATVIEALGGRAGAAELSWPELVAGLGKKKRNGANLTQPGLYRIICLDNRYAAPDAAS